MSQSYYILKSGNNLSKKWEKKHPGPSSLAKSTYFSKNTVITSTTYDMDSNVNLISRVETTPI